MQKFNLITFDLDNTLWPVAEVIERSERLSSEWLANRFPEHAQSLSVNALHQQRDRLIKDKSHYWKNLTKLRIDTLELALSELGIDHKTTTSAAKQAFDVFYQQRNQVNFFPDAIATLEQLGQHYTIGALTNGNSNLKLVGLDSLFDFHFSAEKLGQAKPHPAMFEAALTAANTTADRAIHIGDSPDEDIEGARCAGFEAIWANLNGQQWPTELTAPTHSIQQLNEILGCITNHPTNLINELQ